MRPIPVLLGLAGSVMLGVTGLCDFIGILRAAEKMPALVTLGMVAGCVAVIAGGELFKSKALEWARDAETRWQRRLAFAGFVGFAAISITLAGQGLIAVERATLAPIVAPLDAAVRRAEIAHDAAEKRESDAAKAIDDTIATKTREADEAPGPSERARIRAQRDELSAGRSAKLEPYQRETAATNAALSNARAARAAAPKGFSELTITLPFVGALAFVPWLIAIALEYLTGAVGWISSRRAIKPDVILTHADVLKLDPHGLELIEDDALLEALASFHAACAGKLRGVRNKRRIAS